MPGPSGGTIGTSGYLGGLYGGFCGVVTGVVIGVVIGVINGVVTGVVVGVISGTIIGVVLGVVVGVIPGVNDGVIAGVIPGTCKLLLPYSRPCSLIRDIKSGVDFVLGTRINSCDTPDIDSGIWNTYWMVSCLGPGDTIPGGNR